MNDSTPRIDLRPVVDSDLDVFYGHQCDAGAVHMAAFTSPDPSNRVAFDAHWQRIRNNDRCSILSIDVDRRVAGHIASFDSDDTRELTYWLGREFWGRGIATAALGRFLEIESTRPIHARTAADNIASRRVLEKCGFQAIRDEQDFAAARQAEIPEIVFERRD